MSAQTDNDKSLREHLDSLLGVGNAHISFDDFVKDFPVDKCSERIEGLPYTAWQVLEHMRIALWDILEFSRDAKHVSPKWPSGYWPKEEDAGDASRWNETVESFRQDLEQMRNLVNDPTTDLFAKIAHGSGQMILREALLVADHNAYHLGQLVVVRRALGAWPDDR